MSVWQWIDEFEARAIEAGDAARQRLLDIFYEAQSVHSKNPDHALALYEEGRALAELLHEGWFARLFEHWQIQALLFKKRDLLAARRVAVRAAVEVRKPGYERLPQRICLHEDLIHVYVGSDPHGYAQRIQSALEYMETELSPGLECRLCLLGLRTRFLLDTERVGEANESALRYLASCEGPFLAYHRASACRFLCEIAFLQQMWEDVAGYAQVGERSAWLSDSPEWVVEFRAWRAVALRELGAEQEAQRLYRSAVGRARRLNVLPSRAYYDACAGFHEAAGRPERALRVREQQLLQLSGKGQIADECRCRLERCRLLLQLGLPAQEEIEQARAAAQQLADPAPFLTRLHSVLNSFGRDGDPSA